MVAMSTSHSVFPPYMERLLLSLIRSQPTPDTADMAGRPGDTLLPVPPSLDAASLLRVCIDSHRCRGDGPTRYSTPMSIHIQILDRLRAYRLVRGDNNTYIAPLVVCVCSALSGKTSAAGALFALREETLQDSLLYSYISFRPTKDGVSQKMRYMDGQQPYIEYGQEIRYKLMYEEERDCLGGTPPRDTVEDRRRTVIFNLIVHRCVILLLGTLLRLGVDAIARLLDNTCYHSDRSGDGTRWIVQKMAEEALKQRQKEREVERKGVSSTEGTAQGGGQGEIERERTHVVIVDEADALLRDDPRGYLYGLFTHAARYVERLGIPLMVVLMGRDVSLLKVKTEMHTGGYTCNGTPSYRNVVSMPKCRGYSRCRTLHTDTLPPIQVGVGALSQGAEVTRISCEQDKCNIAQMQLALQALSSPVSDSCERQVGVEDTGVAVPPTLPPGVGVPPIIGPMPHMDTGTDPTLPPGVSVPPMDWVPRAAWSDNSLCTLVKNSMSNSLSTLVGGDTSPSEASLAHTAYLDYITKVVTEHFAAFTGEDGTYSLVEAAKLHMAPDVMDLHISPRVYHLVTQGFMELVPQVPQLRESGTPRDRQRGYTADNMAYCVRTPCDAFLNYAIVKTVESAASGCLVESGESGESPCFDIVTTPFHADLFQSRMVPSLIVENMALLMILAGMCDTPRAIVPIVPTVPIVPVPPCTPYEAMPLEAYLLRLAHLATCSWIGPDLASPTYQGYVCPMAVVRLPPTDDPKEAEDASELTRKLELAYTARTLMLYTSTRNPPEEGLFAVVVPRMQTTGVGAAAQRERVPDIPDVGEPVPKRAAAQSGVLLPARVIFRHYKADSPLFSDEYSLDTGHGASYDGDACSILMVSTSGLVSDQEGKDHNTSADAWLRHRIEGLVERMHERGQGSRVGRLAVFVFDASSEYISYDHRDARSIQTLLDSRWLH
ncbi:hypothetical protein KIPB_000114 [Kipferlia bialata]|uniref:Uncharacterized protein n=1 Tax=Kipferlia bialata TaxID=797122 RepID=A0A9K3GEP3_9EUKA|nr:hypothetical protein KIPB_000114 [Kipferlia bialata]|eukprot:g114.t1